MKLLELNSPRQANLLKLALRASALGLAVGFFGANLLSLSVARDPLPKDASMCSANAREIKSKVAQTHDISMQAEHDAMMALVPIAQATHIAIADGNWSAPSTWSNGQLPSSNAQIHIPQGRSIVFDATTPTLRWLRVDGSLSWAHQQNTQLSIDTIVVTPLGRITIGSDQNPIAAGVSARISFSASSPIDAAWDPQRLSRGLLSHGATRIRGASKIGHVALAAPLTAGATQLTLSADPHGWRVGDQIVVTGARKRGSMWPAWAWTPDANTGVSEDEVRTIIGVNGRIISFHTALRHPHAAPSEPGLLLYVANTTRNVVFETENRPDFSISTAQQRQQRAHVMMMHEGDMRVEYAQFAQLGRTDKSTLVDDPIINIDGLPGAALNPRGRYALHFHRSGARSLMGKPAIARQ
jgi:G8 domain